MKKTHRRQSDIDELRGQIRRTALIPLAIFMFIIGLGLSFAEAYISDSTTLFIGFSTLLISTCLYRAITHRHPGNAQVRVITKEMLGYVTDL